MSSNAEGIMKKYVQPTLMAIAGPAFMVLVGTAIMLYMDVATLQGMVARHEENLRQPRFTREMATELIEHVEIELKSAINGLGEDHKKDMREQRDAVRDRALVRATLGSLNDSAVERLVEQVARLVDKIETAREVKQAGWTPPN